MHDPAAPCTPAPATGLRPALPLLPALTGPIHAADDPAAAPGDKPAAARQLIAEAKRAAAIERFKTNGNRHLAP